MFNPTNSAHIAHLNTPATGTKFWQDCQDDTKFGIRIPGYAANIVAGFHANTLAPTTSLFKGI